MNPLSNKAPRARGASNLEYGLIIAIIIPLVLGLIVVIGNSSAKPLSQVQNVLSSATPAALNTAVVSTPTPIPAPPVAHFTFAVSPGDPHSITFTDNSTGGPIVIRQWYVDGFIQSSTDPALTVTLTSGDHLTALSVSGSGGSPSTYSQTVTVS